MFTNYIFEGTPKILFCVHAPNHNHNNVSKFYKLCQNNAWSAKYGYRVHEMNCSNKWTWIWHSNLKQKCNIVDNMFTKKLYWNLQGSQIMPWVYCYISQPYSITFIYIIYKNTLYKWNDYIYWTSVKKRCLCHSAVFTVWWAIQWLTPFKRGN